MNKIRDPFCIVPLRLIQQEDITPTDVCVYAVLAEAMNSTTGEWAVPRSRVQNELGISRATVTRSFRHLESTGWIERDPVWDEDGRQKASIIRVFRSPAATGGLTDKPLGGLPHETGEGLPHEPRREPDPEVPDPEDQTLIKSGSPTVAVHDRFEEFWNVNGNGHGMKKDKPGSLKAWAKAIKKTDADTLIRERSRYLDWCDSVERYKNNPATWLNAEGWNDELAPLRRRKETAAERMERLNPTTHQDAIDVNARSVRFDAIEVGR